MQKNHEIGLDKPLFICYNISTIKFTLHFLLCRDYNVAALFLYFYIFTKIYIIPIIQFSQTFSPSRGTTNSTSISTTLLLEAMKMFNEVLDSDFYLTWIFLYPHITFTSNKPEQMFEDIITSIQNTNIEAER